jgi:hypothetical protein
MKKLFPVVLIALFVGVVLWQFALPAIAQTTNADDSYQRLLDAQLARAKRSEALFASQEAMQRRGLALLERQEKFMERQEKDLERYEKILATWEKQQQQYQKYLDSLNKK